MTKVTNSHTNSNHLEEFYQNFHLMNFTYVDGYLQYKVRNHALVARCMDAARKLIHDRNLKLIVIDPAGSLASHNTFLVKEVANGNLNQLSNLIGRQERP